ncbi:hypothetical protein GGR51DRAFT_578246 [Nemania sp. FL0031]|nr:hypothetical protein GGR51DRAFT_578246 [Nemania sp. FL0031]
MAERDRQPEKAGLGDILAQPRDMEAEVDIIFVHGLGGDRIKTWACGGQPDGKLWPRDLLPIDCPTARILSFGYNADFAKFYPAPEPIAPELTIDDYSTSLLEALKTLRGETQSERPIIFVAHSMGGLVVTNALSRPHGTDVAKQGIADCTIGILFLGTPFKGSPKADYASILLAIVSCFLPTQPASIKDLRTRSQKLLAINIAFAKFLEGRHRSKGKPHLELACFFEELPLNTMTGLIVPRESATWLGQDAQSIQANHVDMCRFEDSLGSGYKSVAGKLSQWVKDIEKNKTSGRGGGVDGIVAKSIGAIMGEVNNRGVTNQQGLVMGNAYGTCEGAIRLVGSITYNNSPAPGGRLLVAF